MRKKAFEIKKSGSSSGSQKTESRQGQVGGVYGGHLQGREKI